MRYSIGQTAAAAGLSVKAIRYYEQISLIPPAERRDGGVNGYRVFTDRDIAHLEFIHRARLLDFSFDEIRRLLPASTDQCPSVRPEYRPLLEAHLAHIDDRIRLLQSLRQQIESVLITTPAAKSGDPLAPSCDCLKADKPTAVLATGFSNVND